MPRLRIWPIMRGDRGAVAALIAVLLSGGVLLGMAAVVVDVGVLWANRTQLVGGADAGAMAVARVCIANNDRCGRRASDRLADDYVDANATDGGSGAIACGQLRTTSPGIRSCAGQTENLTLCQGSRPPAPAPYVEVRSVEQVPTIFAGVFSGGADVDVEACARVSWGPIRRAISGPSLAVCRSDFDEETWVGGRRVLQPAPLDDDAHDPGADETVLRWRPGGTGCGGGSTGSFMFIRRHSSGDPRCPHQLVVGATENGTIAAETPAGCSSRLRAARLDHRPVPVAVIGSGNTTQGIAMFVITGWRSPSGWGGGRTEEPSNLGLGHRCPRSTRAFCLYGYFTTKIFMDEETGPLSADHFGAVYVKTIG